MSRTVFLAPASTRWESLVTNAIALDRMAVLSWSRFGHVDACAHLCAVQRQQAREGYCMVEISTNIYGFCVRDTLNGGVGTLLSARGDGSATRAVAFAREWHAERPTHREVVIGYVDAERRSELDAALSAPA